MKSVISICPAYDIILIFHGHRYGVSSQVVGRCSGWTERDPRSRPADIRSHSLELRHVRLRHIILPRVLNPVQPYATMDSVFQLFLSTLHSLHEGSGYLDLVHKPVPELSMIAALCHVTGHVYLRNLIDAELLRRVPLLDLDLYYFARAYGLPELRRYSLFAVAQRLGSLLEDPTFGIHRMEVLSAVRSLSITPFNAFLEMVRIFARLESPAPAICANNLVIAMPDSARVSALVESVRDLDLRPYAHEALSVLYRIRIMQPEAELPLKTLIEQLLEYIQKS